MLKIKDGHPNNILIIGDLILDHYIQGAVNRISPEAPVPVLSQASERDVLGGAGNVANNILALGADAILVGVVGQDGPGNRFIELAGQTGISFAPIFDRSRRTTQKTRLLGGQQQLLRVDNEDLTQIDEKIEEEIINVFVAMCIGASAIIISDYKKGLLTPRVLREVISFAGVHSIPTFIDPKGSDYRAYVGANYIKPNRAELEILSGIKCDKLSDVERAAKFLSSETGSTILVTLSQDGMILFSTDGQSFSLPTLAREVFDVSGAGDTAIAAFAFAISQNASPQLAASFANVASGIAVSKIGTASVSFQEILHASQKTHFIDEADQAQHFSLSEAVEVAQNWRRRSFKVGFTNGSFDLLHPGHIALLREAAAQCDRLIVAINSDASVKRLKGSLRPIQNDMARADVVSAIGCVDHVVIFDEDTPLEAIMAICPDVLIKGADYAETEIVGADFVKKNGGKIVRVELKQGHSTTNLVTRSKNN